METQMQPRSNSRNQPTRNITKTIRNVSEAYGCEETNDKSIRKSDIAYYSIWAFLTVVLIIWAIAIYPPSMTLYLAVIMIGILFSGGIFIIKARKI